MKKLLNTLYITQESAYLSLDDSNIVVTVGADIVGRFPLHILENIVVFSYAGASPALIGKCVSNNIGISFFSPQGKFLFRALSESHGNVLLRKQQYRLSDNLEKSCEIAKNFIIGKLYNCRWSVDRTLRDHPMRVNKDLCQRAIDKHIESIKKIKDINDIDSLRGIEGESAQIYFGVFNEMIINQKEEFSFSGRNRRPPQDNVNAMLSFGYSLLTNDCFNALEGVGLDGYVGFMHRDRPGRKSMALDLMEELRPVMVDRFVLSLVNSKQIQPKHFTITQSGAVLFTDEGKKIFLKSWQERKKNQITHPFLKEKVEWGLVPHIQAMLLSRYLRGDIDGYPPFLWK